MVNGFGIAMSLTRNDISWLFQEFFRRYGRPEGANERDAWLAALNHLTISDLQRGLRYLEAQDMDCPCTPEDFARYV